MCLPPSSKEEWINLEAFVNQYNTEFGTRYRPVSFPELGDRTRPQPEVLLSDGQSWMAIERKVFAWPPDHIRHHQLWHEFNELFFAQILPEFGDDAYVLEIEAVDVPSSKRDVMATAQQIAAEILSRRTDVRQVGDISSQGPIPWRFFRLPEYERDEWVPDHGIGVRAMSPFKFYDETQIAQSRPEVTQHMLRTIGRAVPKFEQYASYLRVLVIEFYTDVLSLSLDDLVVIIQELRLPSEIDQIWLAEVVELNRWESTVVYRQVKAKT